MYAHEFPEVDEVVMVQVFLLDKHFPTPVSRYYI